MDKDGYHGYDSSKGVSQPVREALLQMEAELDATNRQVEILSDALAESRREVDAMVALARADEREACAWVCDSLEEQCEKLLVPDEKWPTPADCAHIIRARGNT
jgi:hypothetical protein